MSLTSPPDLSSEVIVSKIASTALVESALERLVSSDTLFIKSFLFTAHPLNKINNHFSLSREFV